ncbi:MAG TPA: hypothetical protein VF491_24100 [Vicinamibacterales bacterium]
MLLPAAGAVLGLVATAAAASVDTSPPPGGVYRLKPGIYVQQGIDCSSPPNAALRQYDGRGISDPHTRSCRVRVLARKENRYSVSQSCIDAGAGPAPRISERQTVVVQDALTFSQRTRGAPITYRYCPAYMLPPELRGAVK